MAMGLSHALETRYRRRAIRGRPLYERESERISIMARSQRLQSRPNTLAQTNCHRSFFACNSAADHTFPVSAFFKGESTQKNFPLDWRKRFCSLWYPAHVMLRGSGGFLFLR